MHDLIKSGNANKEGPGSYTMPGFTVENIYPIFKHCFNTKAATALNTKSNTGMLHQYNEMVGPTPIIELMSKLGVKSCKAALDSGTMGYLRKIDKVNYIASRCTMKTMPKAVERVIATVNHLADKDFCKASMMELGVIRFVKVNEIEDHFAVLSYLTLTQAGENYVAASQVISKMMVKEGDVPNNIEEQV